MVTNATAVAAIYPQSHLLIDHSTMLKMEGYINFTSPSLSTKVSKKSASDFKHTSLLMPEQHSSVPGFDTLIRFLVPLLDSFGLYGRPKDLKPIEMIRTHYYLVCQLYLMYIIWN